MATDIILVKTAADHSQQHTEAATDLFGKRTAICNLSLQVL